LSDANSRPPWKRVVRATLDVVLLAGILFFGRSLYRPAMGAAGVDADVKSDVETVEREARALHEAFARYFERNGRFPNAWAEPCFDEVSLDPLRELGYYTGLINSKLLEGRIDAYDSPDDRGTNAEYWIEMTLASDPAIRFVVARSDDAPLAGGRWLDGAYLVRNGSLDPL